MRKALSPTPAQPPAADPRGRGRQRQAWLAVRSRWAVSAAGGVRWGAHSRKARPRGGASAVPRLGDLLRSPPKGNEAAARQRPAQPKLGNAPRAHLEETNRHWEVSRGPGTAQRCARGARTCSLAGGPAE